MQAVPRRVQGPQVLCRQAQDGLALHGRGLGRGGRRAHQPHDKTTTESSVVIHNNLTFVSNGMHDRWSKIHEQNIADTRPAYKSAPAPDM